MTGYQIGLQPVLDYAMKQYKRHRRIPKGVTVQIHAEYEAQQAQKRA